MIAPNIKITTAVATIESNMINKMLMKYYKFERDDTPKSKRKYELTDDEYVELKNSVGVLRYLNPDLGNSAPDTFMGIPIIIKNNKNADIDK